MSEQFKHLEYKRGDQRNGVLRNSDKRYPSPLNPSNTKTDEYTREPDGEREHPYAGRNERVKSGDRNAEAEAEKASEELRDLKRNAKTQQKCEGSYCTISGGKRRKSRKQSGNRKSKKSRRR